WAAALLTKRVRPITNRPERKQRRPQTAYYIRKRKNSMMFPKSKSSSCAIAVAVLFMVCAATPARAQSFNFLQLPATATSPDGLLTAVLSSSNPSDAVDVNNTYTWTATNNSSTVTLTRVVLGSHWGDYCVGTPGVFSDECRIAPPEGPTLISLAPGCG